ncbi:hypothetical protein [Parasphingorhabdus sp. NYA22]
MNDISKDQLKKLESPAASEKWTTPQLIDLDGVDGINSFVGPLSDVQGIANGTDPTTS